MSQLFEHPGVPGLFYGKPVTGRDPFQTLWSWVDVMDGYYAPVTPYITYVKDRTDSRAYAFLLGLLQNPKVVSNDELVQHVLSQTGDTLIVSVAISGVPVPAMVIWKAVAYFCDQLHRMLRITSEDVFEPAFSPTLAILASSSQLRVEELALLSQVPFTAVGKALRSNPIFTDDHRVMAGFL